MMYWIYDYPSWVIGLLFCSALVAFTWIGIFLTRATVHSWGGFKFEAQRFCGSRIRS